MTRAFAGLVVASALCGCVDTGDQAFVILNNSAPSDDSCSFTGETDQQFLSNGHILTISPMGYQLFPLMQSRLTASMGQESQRTIKLLGARVDLTFPSVTKTDASGVVTDLTDQISVDESLTKFKQLRSASIPPGGTANVGLEVVPWGVIPQITRGVTINPGDRFRAIAVAKVVMYGEMGGGGEVESDPFTYPIEICNDCIANVVGPCPATPAVAGHPCNPYQDGTIDCCMDTSNRLVCPAAP